MKFTIRFTVVLVIIAMIAAIAPKSVQAQGSPNFGLSDADAKLLKDSFSSFKAKSFQMDYTFKVNVTGAPNGDATVDVTGSGPFAFDATKMTPGGGQMAALGGLTFQNVISANVTSAKTTMNSTTEIRIVDGEIYVKGDMATKGKWMKANLADALKTAQSSMTKMNPMMGGPGGAATPSAAGMQAAAMTIFSDPDVQTALAQIPNIPGFIVAKRGADQTVDTVTVATITVTADFTKFAASPAFKSLIKAGLKFQATQKGADPTTVTDDQVTSFATIAQSTLKKGTITLTFLVGAKGEGIRGFGFSVDASVDSSMMTGKTTPINATVDFLIKLSKLDQPVTVDVPAGATDFPMPGASGSTMPQATMEATSAQ